MGIGQMFAAAGSLDLLEMEHSMDDNGVTGARVDVEMTVGMSPDKFWALVTDVSRIGEWSPECMSASWLENEEEGEGAPPRVGDRFEAHNEYPDGYTATVQCVVTEADPSSAFAWVVLDDDAFLDQPGSMWRYDLRPGDSPDSTVVRHSFEHGPGVTGLRESVRQDPANAATHLDGRLAELRLNMTATLAAMARG
jgi:hypothetical protein